MSFKNKTKSNLKLKFKPFRSMYFLLASKSPRRKEILKNLGLKFNCQNSNLNEEIIKKRFKDNSFKKLAEILSLAKALSVLENTKINTGFVIGSDTLVICNKKIIGKPKNKKEALNNILFLSNKSHFVVSGIALINIKNKEKILTVISKEKDPLKKVLLLYKLKLSICNSDSSTITMREVTLAEAKNYVSTKEPYDKAGGYAIQGKAKKFIKSIRGDIYNVIGFPVDKFYLILKRLKLR